MRCKIPSLLTDPSKQFWFWFADALNLEIHDPFKEGSAENRGAERQAYCVTNDTVCLYDKLRTPLKSDLPSGTCFCRRFGTSPVGLTSGISPKLTIVVPSAVLVFKLLVFLGFTRVSFYWLHVLMGA
jgi:hypothetical protein